MGFWSPFSASMSAGTENQNTSSYGDRTPIISDQYKDAYGAAKGNIGADGYTGIQRGGVNLLTQLNDGSRRNFINGGNQVLNNYAMRMNDYTTNDPHLVGGGPTVTAKTGADYMNLYKDPYQRDVVDTALADYDTGVDTNRAGMRAANSGSFGNKRYGVAEGQFAGEAARGRGTLAANLLSTGFNTSAQLGQSDADRNLSADTTTANIQNSRDLADQNARQVADQQSIQSLKDMAGLTQQQIDNFVKADGIDMEVAQSMFAAGTISQSQLNDIAQMAASWNGSSYKDNKTTDKTYVNGTVSVG